MKELWEIAIQAHNLPLTCVVGLLMLYWIACIAGVLGVDSFDLDLDVDVDADVNPGDVGVLATAMRFVNATDVPFMAVLTILSLSMWGISVAGNYYFNPELHEGIILAFFCGAFVVGVLITKAVTTPLVPVFRKMKELEKAEPAVGGVAVVVSKSVTEKYGQVEQKRKEGAPATLSCRISGGEALSRGTEVVVVSYDQESGTYLVRKI